MKKFMLRVMPIVFVVVLMAGNYALAASNYLSGVDMNGNGVGTVTAAANSIWSTVLVICRILAVAAVVFAGVKYMFAGADEKANIKTQMVILVVGAVLVFGASFVIDFIMGAGEQVLNS